MSRQDWGIGLIGLGGIANTHLQAYLNAGLKVVGGADVDKERLRLMKERWELSIATTNWEELVDHPDVRVLDITAPHKKEIRLPIVEYAGLRKKALLIQKPLCPYLKDAKEIVDTAERLGVPLMVNQNSVFVPAFQAMEPYLRNGAIGIPYYCQIENRNWVDVSAHSWFGKDKRWVTSDMAIHHFALVHHWFGVWETIYAQMGRDPSQNGVVGDNWSVVQIHFQNGVKATVINNWAYRGHRPKPHSREEIIIQGDRGVISGDSEEICVVTTDPPARIFPQFQGKWFPDAFANVMTHFIDCLDQGKPFLCSGRDNLNAIAMIEGAYLSAEEGRSVTRREVMEKAGIND
ncbi:MAG: Gfo/Idh/MocA family oxidoreductase [Armatimonadetes bacterium]|nr:Gfo/Idh/MocA family oxidoreductase [Armatimonadota bacterium]MDW8122928.1 Gfo/Idh/MocA family oxidoreductase [Armatimonadota bacterium]